MILVRGTLLISRYRIVEILGQGGMGSVYRAIDENLDIDVAVKDNSFTSEEYARQFRREATILATLRHPGLTRVTDHFVIENQGQYLVMDYIEGEDLRQRMERVGTLPEGEVIVIGAAICDALVYLSSRNPPVIHRDIKPGNVKITPEGHIYLVDFGLAKTIQGSQATTTGARAMTPGFSPPEQYGTARTDHRTDIFSLGATLYAALTGTTPEDSLARAMGQAELTPVRKQNPRVSRRLSVAIEKSLELIPDDRYQSPEEFKQALLNANTNTRRRSGEYVVAPPPEQEKELAYQTSNNAEVMNGNRIIGAPPNGDGNQPAQPPYDSEIESRVIKPISTPLKSARRRVRSLLLLVLIVGALAVGIFAIRNDSGISIRTLAQYLPAISTYLPFPTPTLDQANLSPPTVTIPAVEPSLAATNEIAVIASPTRRPVASTATLTPEISTPTVMVTPLPTPIGGASGQIAFASKATGTSQIFLINSDGSGLRQITNIPEGACQPDFSPDTQRIIFTSPCDANNDYYMGSSLYILNVDGTGFLPLPTMVGGDYDPAWSPDGRYIAFTSLRNSSRPSIFVLDLEDYSVRTLSQKYALDSQPAWSRDGKHIIFISDRNGRQDIWVMDTDGKNLTQFTLTPYLDFNPSWSSDGKDVIFTQYVALGSIPRAVSAPYQPDNYAEYVIGKEKRPMRDAVMSPDGYWIAFEGWEAGGKHNIFIISTTGINITRVTDDPAMAFDPVWKPQPTTP